MDEKRLSIETAMLLQAVNENPARHQYVPLKPVMDTPEITTWDLIKRIVNLELERDAQAERIRAVEHPDDPTEEAVMAWPPYKIKGLAMAYRILGGAFEEARERSTKIEAERDQLKTQFIDATLEVDGAEDPVDAIRRQAERIRTLEAESVSTLVEAIADGDKDIRRETATAIMRALFQRSGEGYDEDWGRQFCIVKDRDIETICRAFGADVQEDNHG